MQTIREAAVAGQFYPADAAELNATICDLLDNAETQPGPAPKALIVPHAGYRYCGSIAAAAYARLRPYRTRYTRVVLLGPCHRVATRGLALCSADAFRTPLGDVPVDKDVASILDLPQVSVFDASHRAEHSLEVHLPFLQLLLDRFSLVPLLVGDATYGQVAEVLDTLWGGRETLIVVSSDLSHYLAYEQARRLDRTTCAAIEELDGRSIDHHNACGVTPIGGLLSTANRRGLTVTTLKLRNSGDTCGEKDRVVGYGAWMFAG